MTEFHQAIAQQIAVLANITESQAIECIEEPRNKNKADLAVMIARINRFTKLVGNPAQIASEWKTKIIPNKWILSVTNEGPYLNFSLNKMIIAEQVIKKVFDAPEKWGCTNIGENKIVVVEYSSPNIAKPFHAGHIRSTIIGNFIKNLHNMLGYKTVSINYLGDWGKQYGLLAVGFEKYGNEEKLKLDPIRHLYEVYVKINKDIKPEKEKKEKKEGEEGEENDDNDNNDDDEKDGNKNENENSEKNDEKWEEKIKNAKIVDDAARAYFKRMEDGDESALEMWKRFRDLSITECKNIYKRLNVEFDVYTGESEQKEGMERELEEMKNKNILTEDKGALLVNLQEYGLNKTLVQKSDGATLYITRDISAATERFEKYNFTKMIYVVAAQQDLHFQQLFKILNLMDKKYHDKCQHVNFGMVLGMSTRKGKVEFLSTILDKAKAKMMEVMKESKKGKISEIENPDYTADIAGLSAVVVQDLAAKRIKDYTFNWDRVFSFEGDTGPYLQIQHSRLCSMEKKSGIKITNEIDFSLLSEPIAQDLARMVGKFPDIVVQAGSNLEPVTVVTYLFDLAKLVSAAQSVLMVKKIQDKEPKLAEARMVLFWTARITLGNGLKLIGLIPLEKM